LTHDPFATDDSQSREALNLSNAENEECNPAANFPLCRLRSGVSLER